MRLTVESPDRIVADGPFGEDLFEEVVVRVTLPEEQTTSAPAADSTPQARTDPGASADRREAGSTAPRAGAEPACTAAPAVSPAPEESVMALPSARELIRGAFMTLGALVAAAGVALGAAQIFVWLTGRVWNGPSTLGMLSGLGRALGLSVPPALDRWLDILGPLFRLLDVVPAAIPLFLLGTWTLWRAVPPPRPVPKEFELLARRLERTITQPCLVVVSRQWPSLYEYLRMRLRERPEIAVVMDRRWEERRRMAGRMEVDSRRGSDRRVDERGRLDWDEQVRVIARSRREDGGRA